jgi:hypothetical protein
MSRGCEEEMGYAFLRCSDMQMFYMNKRGTENLSCTLGNLTGRGSRLSIVSVGGSDYPSQEAKSENQAAIVVIRGCGNTEAI